MDRENQQKLILINRYFYPDHSATSQMLTDLAFSLAEVPEGKEIHIVTSRQRYDDPSARLEPYQCINNVHIHRIATTRFGRQNLIGRAIDYFSFYVTALIKLLRLTKNGDTLIAKTDPPMISVIAAIVAKLKNAHLINWLQDLFPEVAEKLGVKFIKGVPFKLLKTIRNISLKSADMNVVIGELMAERLKDEGISDNKITVIPNWAGDQLQPVPHHQNSLRSEWGLQGKFVVGYSGNMGRGHDFTTILEAVRSLKNKDDIVFLFIGGGAQLSKVNQICKRENLNNTLFKEYQPREKLSESLSVADIHLVSLKPELESLIVPSKFYGILAVGRPVIFIGNANGELSKIIEKEHCGENVSYNDVKKLISIIEKKSLQALNQGKVKYLRNLFEQKYSRQKATSSFMQIITPV